MIISHKYRFIFIKTRKTAGTSIEIFLSRHCGEEDVVTPIRPPVAGHEPRNHQGLWNPLPELRSRDADRPRETLRQLVRRQRFYNHIPARVLRHRIPADVWRDYFVFCVERNPWDKALSHYAMINERSGGHLSFDAYLAQGFFPTDFDKYTDAEGRLLVDEVLRYESLNEELGRVFARLGAPFDGDLGVRAKSGYRSDRRPYQEVYDDQQREVIARAFAREIEMFGYRFEE